MAVKAEVVVCKKTVRWLVPLSAASMSGVNPPKFSRLANRSSYICMSCDVSSL